MTIPKPIKEKLFLTQSLARTSGKMAKKLRQKISKNAFISEKAPQDFLTMADTQVQKFWYDTITSHYPDDNILAEEDNTPAYGQQDKGKGVWVIDPIDGTTNFMQGLPEWGISIAYIQGDIIQFSVIYLPDLKRLLWAVHGQGAFVSVGKKAPRKIQVSSETNSCRSTIILSRSNRWGIESHLSSIARLEKNNISYRFFGSASYSLACVAQGQAEGFYEPHLKPWDIPAGLLLVQEAGGAVQSPPLCQIIKEGGTLLAYNGKIPMIDMMA